VSELQQRARLARTIRDGRAREIRQEANVTQAEVASELGVTKAAVSAWELGRRRPRGELALRYGQLLDEIGSAFVGAADVS